jgi:decaprenylphospho-beta-D-ribofuranose 2-oxidase
MKIEEEFTFEPSQTKNYLADDWRNHSLPQSRLERVQAWGRASEAMSFVYRPSTLEGIQQVLNVANTSYRSIGLRGAGYSYGDATLNGENITLDMRRMNRILDWNPDSGRIQVEPGVTISQLWQYVLEDGWWPAVVPGTANPTIGGCAGMNVHGKNAWKSGTIGDHISEFELMIPSGDVVTCNRENNRDLFYSAIGGFGMLGIFTSLTLNLKRVYSGLLEVEAQVSSNLKEMMDQFEENLANADYLVGWIDSFARGNSLGRGQIHIARYLPPGVDPNPHQTMRLDYQHLSDVMFGIIPRSIMWRFMRPLFNNLGARFTNMGKYWTSKMTDGSIFLQSHVAFHFLLDYVPNFKLAYGPGGLIQYQCFIPKKNALGAFNELLQLCQKRGLQNYLTVFKRHRPDDFLISHGVDGYSMAMDFRVTPSRQAKLLALSREMDEVVIDAGGRFYLAKDSTLRPEIVHSYLGQEAIERFRSLKEHYDPGSILQTNMWRRLFN